MPPLTLPELERLHALYADGVLGFFCMNTGSRHEAEDLVQEFFVKLARKATGCADPATERGWIFTAARNSNSSPFFRLNHARSPPQGSGALHSASGSGEREQPVLLE